MKTIRIVLGADHRGYALKEFLKQQQTIAHYTISWFDVGTHSQERTDYPLFAQSACKVMLEGIADYGILLCGTGVGMAIAANRFKGIYAGLVWNTEIARLSKEDDNTNILVLPSDYMHNEQALEILHVWLKAEFKQGRYQERITMIDTNAI
jgi:ribose 5-phosphate isomerase B